MALLVRPSAMSPSTSRSRGDSVREGPPAGPGEQLGDDLGVEARCRRRPPGARRRGTRRRRRSGPSAGSRARRCRPRAARWRTAPPRTGRARGSPIRASASGSAARPAGRRRCGSAACARRRSRGLAVALDGLEQSVGVADRGDDVLVGVGEQAGQARRAAAPSLRLSRLALRTSLLRSPAARAGRCCVPRPRRPRLSLLRLAAPSLAPRHASRPAGHQGISTMSVVGPPEGSRRAWSHPWPTRLSKPCRPVPREASAPPMPSSRTSTTEPVAGPLDGDRGDVVHMSMAGHVGERFGDHEVGGALHDRWGPFGARPRREGDRYR